MDNGKKDMHKTVIKEEKKQEVTSEDIKQDKIVKEIEENVEPIQQDSMEIESPTHDELGPRKKAIEDRRMKMIFYEGKWYYEEEMGDILTENRQEESMYSSNHKGDIILELNLSSKYKLKSKIQNNLKIAAFIHSKGIKVKSMKVMGFNKTEIKFRNFIEANRCLDTVKKQPERKIEARIPRKITRRKGIITNWDKELPLHELAEALDNSKKELV